MLVFYSRKVRLSCYRKVNVTLGERVNHSMFSVLLTFGRIYENSTKTDGNYICRLLMF